MLCGKLHVWGGAENQLSRTSFDGETERCRRQRRGGWAGGLAARPADGQVLTLGCCEVCRHGGEAKQRRGALLASWVRAAFAAAC